MPFLKFSDNEYNYFREMWLPPFNHHPSALYKILSAYKFARMPAPDSHSVAFFCCMRTLHTYSNAYKIHWYN